MNSSVFQIVVAGFLITAWLWVLGRPLLSKISYLVRRMRSDDGGIDYVRPSVASLSFGVVNRSVLHFLLRPFWAWREQSIFSRRRQTLMALSLLALGSALAAVILRGLFLFVPGATILLLIAYLSVAVRIGGRILLWQDQVKAAEYRRLELASQIARASDIKRGVQGAKTLGAAEDASLATSAAGPGRSFSGDEAAMRNVASPSRDEQSRDAQSSDAQSSAEQSSDMTDPTLRVKGSRRRRNPSRRILFRRPAKPDERVLNDPVAETFPLKSAANDR